MGQVRQAVEAVPLEAGEFHIGGIGLGLIVILDVTSVDKKVWIKGEHAGVNLVPVRAIPARVLLAGNYHKGNGCFLLQGRGGTEFSLDSLA